MAISTTLDSEKLLETLQKIIYEWLNTLFTIGTDVQGIYPYILQDQDAESMKNPWCEYIITIPSQGPTGAGALGTEARFRYPNIEIAFRMKRPGTELDLVLLGDKLDNFFRHATNGRPALGTAGLRMANLAGPIPDNTIKYYLLRYFLNCRVLVSND